MQSIKENVTLTENLAAVRCCQKDPDDPTGAITVIPAAAVIQINRTERPAGRMGKVEWKGATYSVFWEDMLKRVDRTNRHRVDNPSIVPIQPAEN